MELLSLTLYFSPWNHADFLCLFVFFFCRIVPSFGKVSPVGDHVAGDVTMLWPVSERRGERLSKDILKVVRVVGSHPAGEGPANAAHTVGLREQVGVGASSSLVKKGRDRSRGQLL